MSDSDSHTRSCGMASIIASGSTLLNMETSFNHATNRQTVGECKKWSEARQAVKLAHRDAAANLNRIPQSFTVREVNGKHGSQQRVYFLSALPNHRENTLVSVDLHLEMSEDSAALLTWRDKLAQLNQMPSAYQMSREEQLLRERKRIRSFGLMMYDYQQYGDVGKFAFISNSSVFVCCDPLIDGKLSTESVVAREVPTSCTNSRIDCKLCPSCPNLLAFVSGSDLWVANIETGQEQRLTFTHSDAKRLVDNPRSAGVASFVVQEEFDRCTGYWWQPVHDTDESEQSVYHLLYEEVDESDVRILHIVPPVNEGGSVDEYRYPTAGTANAKCTLKIVEFTVSKDDGSIVNIKEKRLVEPLSSLFPSMEYLLRAGWMSDSHRIYVELIDRRQQNSLLVVFDLDSFQCRSADAPDLWLAEDDTHGMQVDVSIAVVVYKEHSDLWLHVHDLLHFFPQTSPDQLSFIRGSERSGFMHLYLTTVSLDRDLTMEGDFNDFHFPASPQSPSSNISKRISKAKVLSEVALTSGQWEVDSKQLWVDEERKLAYFIGYRDTPLESHLYVVSYEHPDEVTRLTKPGFSHIVQLDKACNSFVTVFSSLSTSTECAVYKLNPAVLSVNCLGFILQPVEVPEIKPPELFSYTSKRSGYTMHGMLYRCSTMEKKDKYPVVLFVYGGPQVQLVSNSYKAIRFLRLHILSALGYVVVVIDGRGSAHRGMNFISPIQEKLGCVEIDDQVEGLEWLASQHDFIDLQRVAIHGWSYGGYLSLIGLIQRPDIFKVAIAGAPVTSWHLYDTGYTERYMDLPANNPNGYKAGSVIEAIDKFPDDEGRLLIIQGLMDENVHFYHTSSLIDALIKACKPHQLQVYPNERHGIRSSEANEHYETLLINFLKKHL